MITVAPILSEVLGRNLSTNKYWRLFEDQIAALQFKLRGVIWPTVVVFGSILIFGINRSFTKHPYYSFDSRVFPVHAVDWLEAHPQPGNMFNDIDWSGYILHQLWPEQKVYIDSRTDFYGEPMLRDYENIITASPGWTDLFHKYNVTWALIHLDSPLAKALQDASWFPLYRDSLSVIFQTPDTP